MFAPLALMVLPLDHRVNSAFPHFKVIAKGTPRETKVPLILITVLPRHEGEISPKPLNASARPVP